LHLLVDSTLVDATYVNDEKNALGFGGFKTDSFLCSANQKECIYYIGKYHTGSSFESYRV
jgi:hypothetical protein